MAQPQRKAGACMVTDTNSDLAEAILNRADASRKTRCIDCDAPFTAFRTWQRHCCKCWPRTRLYAQRTAHRAVNPMRPVNSLLMSYLLHNEPEIRALAEREIDMGIFSPGTSRCLDMLDNPEAWL